MEYEYMSIQNIIKSVEKGGKSKILDNMSISQILKLYNYSIINPTIVISKLKPSKEFLKNCLKGEY